MTILYRTSQGVAKKVYPTKKNVVSVSSKIYHPFIILLQLIQCKARIGWDDALTRVLLSKWVVLFNNVQQVHVNALQIHVS